MKYPLILAMCAAIATVVLFSAVMPVNNSPALVRGGSAITIGAAPGLIANCSPLIMHPQPASGTVIAATGKIPAYVRNLLRPLGGPGERSSVIGVVAEPERQVMFPSIPLVPYLGLDISLGGFYQKSRVQEFFRAGDQPAPAMQKTTAGIEIRLGNSSPLRIRFSGWLGLPCADTGPDGGAEHARESTVN